MNHYTICHDQDSLYGSTDPEEERIDTDASLREFKRQITQAIREVEPDAEIEFHEGGLPGGAYSLAEVYDVDVNAPIQNWDEQSWLDDLIGRVHGEWDWIVQAETVETE